MLTAHERVQLTVSNMYTDRYIVSCNGRRLPLKLTNIRGEHVPEFALERGTLHQRFTRPLAYMRRWSLMLTTAGRVAL